MPEYRATLKIDIKADNADEAMAKALFAMRNLRVSDDSTTLVVKMTLANKWLGATIPISFEIVDTSDVNDEVTRPADDKGLVPRFEPGAFARSIDREV